MNTKDRYWFSAVKKGHYQITDGDEVVADIVPAFKYAHGGLYIPPNIPPWKCGKMGTDVWGAGWYVVFVDEDKEHLLYKNLYEVHDAFCFVNYPGPYKVLRRR